MKPSSPKQMAVYISIVASALSGGMMVYLVQAENGSQLLPIIFSVLSIFIITYIITYYLLNDFIFKKINPIYKTIQRYNLSQKELQKKFEDKDIIREVNNDVVDWAQQKTREIKKLREMEQYRKEFLGNVSHGRTGDF